MTINQARQKLTERTADLEGTICAGRLDHDQYLARCAELRVVKDMVDMVGELDTTKDD